MHVMIINHSFRLRKLNDIKYMSRTWPFSGCVNIFKERKVGIVGYDLEIRLTSHLHTYVKLSKKNNFLKKTSSKICNIFLRAFNKKKILKQMIDHLTSLISSIYIRASIDEKYSFFSFFFESKLSAYKTADSALEAILLSI